MSTFVNMLCKPSEISLHNESTARRGPWRAVWRYVNLFGKFFQLFYVNRTFVRYPERVYITPLP